MTFYCSESKRSRVEFTDNHGAAVSFADREAGDRGEPCHSTSSDKGGADDSQGKL